MPSTGACGLIGRSKDSGTQKAPKPHLAPQTDEKGCSPLSALSVHVRTCAQPQTCLRSG